jgi:hypothetical protein
MGAQEREETNRPLGVLDCLMVGFEMLGQDWWLLALPVALDLFFWLGPQLSIAPLVQWLMAFLKGQPAPDPEAARQLVATVQALKQFGEKFNLFSLISAIPLLSPPTLLAQHTPGAVSPIGERAVFSVTNLFALTAWGGLLIPAGLVLGFVYLNNLASHVHALWRAKTPSQDPSTTETGQVAETRQETRAGCLMGSTLGKLIRVLIFAIGLLTLVALFIPIWSLVVGTATMIAQFFGLVVWGLTLGTVSFIILHLVFVIHGVLLGERGLLRAILESIALIRANFLSSVGLVMAVVLIYQGLGYVWSLPSGNSWLLLIGILGNSCIATGLITGTFVFYQERIDMLMGGRRRPATT